MNKLFFLSVFLLSTIVFGQKSIHDFEVIDIEGNSFKMSTLKGKKVMIVNTASECGLTPQYKQLEEVYKKYQDKLVIIGFPANNFGAQEPGSDKQISTFCEKNYGVSFPMMSKVSVKGSDQCDLYKFLTNKKLNGLEDSEVQWNFQKYLINEKGELVRVVNPRELPNSDAIIKWIKS
jgi:glutathione peroxidase